MNTNDLTQKFKEACRQPVQEQAKQFLKAFVLEFSGSFEEVLELGTQFSKYIKTEGGNDLEEHDAHLFLEKRGEPLTVKELRENLKKELTLEKNHNVAFLEFVLWKYNKTATDLLTPPSGEVPPELLAALEKAISGYQVALEARRIREEKMAKLAEIAAQGGVKGKAAQNELDQMKTQDQLEQNKKELTNAAAKRKAQKAVDDKEAHARIEAEKREAALKSEQERLAAEKQRKEEEEARKKADSRSALKAKASLWQ
eukprot:TRINITY_DN13276_c0_g1_i1.p1 TRINITY_DN13276_c0_g1~~TRINITY_DN13276_c0_g1_i1.p1  ORF type:complete len:269 (+),score=102.83 TRINITY_DN13276_c0_g1_i1:42-809(+)